MIDYNDFVYPSILMLGDYNNSVILDCPADKQLEMADALSPNYIMFESGSEFDYDLKEYLPDISFGYDY